MSDEEDEYEYEYDEDEQGDAMETDGFQYTDDEEEQDSQEIALENAYYNAKGLRDTNLDAAADALEKVIKQESEALDNSKFKYGPWSFKALKQLCKLQLRANRSPDSQVLLSHYERLLECMQDGNVSPNAMEKGIQSLLDRVATQSSLALPLYHATLPVVHPTKGSCPNERLWFKITIKYGQLLFETSDSSTSKLQEILEDLQQFTSQQQSGTGSSSRMELYALQMQLYARQQDVPRLRSTFQRAMAVRGGLPHPRTLALIQELGGQLQLQGRQYKAASQSYFQAFKSYDEAGDRSRLRCLKYLVLASLLDASSINPFDSQEARPYKEDPEIVAMTNLVQAFHDNDIVQFERVLKQNQKRLLEDDLLQTHVNELLRTIRLQVLKRVIKPYNCISLQAIAHQLNNMDVDGVVLLLTQLILDGELPGASLDRVSNVLYQRRSNIDEKDNEKIEALQEVLNSLQDQSTAMANTKWADAKSQSLASSSNMRSVVR